MGQRIRVITDSLSDIPPEIAQRLGIRVVPIYLYINGISYRDDGNLDHKWFYDHLTQDTTLPQTAAPAAEEILSVYQTLVAEGAEEIVTLFMDSHLSSLSTNARLAAKQLVGGHVHIMETSQVSMGIGWMVIAAAEAAQQGASVADIADLVADMRQRTLLVGVLNSLEHLRRGGRIGWARARFGDMLQIKPLILFQEGEARLVGQVRTYRRALSWLVDWVREVAPLERLAFLHSHLDPAIVAQLCSDFSPYVPDANVMLVEVGPIFSTHVGPNGVGVALVRAKGTAC